MFIFVKKNEKIVETQSWKEKQLLWNVMHYEKNICVLKWYTNGKWHLKKGKSSKYEYIFFKYEYNRWKYNLE